MLTSTFAHADLTHFGVNMFVLHSFASPVCIARHARDPRPMPLYLSSWLEWQVIHALGASAFLTFYLSAGLASSALHLVYTRYILPRLESNSFRTRSTGYDLPSLGASGSVMGTMGINRSTLPHTMRFSGTFLTSGFQCSLRR